MAIQDWIAKGGKSAALSFVLLKRVTRITLFENCQKVFASKVILNETFLVIFRQCEVGPK